MYQNLKSQIKDYAVSIKQTDDKPLFNMCLNDFLDSLRKNEIENLILKGKISVKKGEQYTNWLSCYICTLHK